MIYSRFRMSRRCDQELHDLVIAQQISEATEWSSKQLQQAHLWLTANCKIVFKALTPFPITDVAFTLLC